MKKNLWRIVLAVLLALNLIATCVLAVRVAGHDKHFLKDATVHYTLYIGTNDKDTYKQEIPTEEAKHIVDEICTKYVNGFTVQDSIGTWNDENDVITHETTIMCYLDDIDEETLHRICEEIRVALNQNTVLIQKEYTALDFYAGTDGEEKKDEE